MYKGNRIRECPHCGKLIRSLGWARHRAMHYDQGIIMKREEARQNNVEGVQTHLTTAALRSPEEPAHSKATS